MRHVHFLIPLFTSFFLGTWGCTAKHPPESEVTPVHAPQWGAPKPWVLGGFLPSAPHDKVWVKIEGKRITNIVQRRPEGVLAIDTNGLIFPGLIDMHNHIKYSVLPLWDKAHGQFTNRFEWRKNYPPYTEEVHRAMDPIFADPTATCAAVRWGEIKALTGGATSVQGIGVDEKCGEGFGVHNLEIAGEFDNSKGAESLGEVIKPDLLRTVFIPMLLKYMNADLSNYDEALEKFKAEGNLTEEPAKSYMEFENSVRQPIFDYYRDPDALTVFAHLAEGMRNDDYNKQEYKFAKMYGYTGSEPRSPKPLLTIIHGVGLSVEDLQDAARNGISIVWSPFSNLLLYGETLDVEAARRAGVNLTLGPDWSPTGSKHMLDELKIAMRYLDMNGINIGNGELVAMATTNAAKAMRLDRVTGKIEPGFFADILVVKKKSHDPFADLINANQEDVELVVVAGQPLYGEREFIEAAADAFGDPKETTELMPQQVHIGNSGEGDTTCQFPHKKALRNPGPTPVDRIPDTTTRSVRIMTAYEIDQFLNSKMPSRVDPLFNCESPEYSTRLANFIESEIKDNAAKRQSRRKEENLGDGYNPMAVGK